MDIKAFEPMAYVTYYRVSTPKQGMSGLGLDAQRKSVADYLSRVGGEVLAEYTDIESGSKNDRKNLQAALKKCRLTGSILLIAKLDRLSRNRSFLMTLQDSNLEFVCVDMPEANRLTIGLLAVMADYERQLISERTKAALQAAKARGTVLGNPNLALVRNTDTKAATQAKSEKAKLRNDEVLAIINELKGEHGELSHVKLAVKLNEAGYKTARGCLWTKTQVRRLVA